MLNCPIFSIDYKKAPSNPYPEGLNDIWQAYNWILNYASTFFSKKIYLFKKKKKKNFNF